ncbi:hypothetical protein AAFF_G00387740 [Aldrovandia affinis]|uniref:Secreted protein n=1 Tax=Aldrovandia affinis TaxID=143900 RepID=A0AAD7SEN4_9TELE|nr:hypothetical protein AAFF_G00387740 [Aldrovandia affinis]
MFSRAASACWASRLLLQVCITLESGFLRTSPQASFQPTRWQLEGLRGIVAPCRIARSRHRTLDPPLCLQRETYTFQVSVSSVGKLAVSQVNFNKGPRFMERGWRMLEECWRSKAQ